MSQIWNNILDLFQSALSALHDVFVPLAGDHAWGWAIIAITLVVRMLMLPLAIKQIRSMRAMQAIQPQMKELQKKYKVDRELMKKDPEQYRAKKQKLNEEMMALYQREGVNPMASCLPLLAQAPVFFALFSILRGGRAAELANQPFYFVTMAIDPEAEFTGLGALVSQASWPGWLLIALMAGTMFLSTKQTMARQPTSGDGPMAQQQKIMLYVMPVFLAVISFNFPLGVLLYWVTTNTWQAVQQWFMLREVKHEAEEGTLADHPGGEAAARPKLSRKKGKRSAKGEGTVGGPAGGDGAGRGTPNPGATSGKGGASSGGPSKGSSTEGGAPGKAGDNGSTPVRGDGAKGSGAKGGGAKGGGAKGGGAKGSGAKGGGAKGSDRSPGPNGSGGARPKRDHLPRRGDRS